MSVDFLVCEHCGKTFCDCGSYVCCEGCGEVWCSEECAEADGYEEAHCKLDIETEDGYVNDNCEGFEDCVHKNKIDSDGEVSCCDCKVYAEESCNYCRKEDYEDSTLLDKAIELLNCDRQYLIDKINEK